MKKIFCIVISYLILAMPCFAESIVPPANTPQNVICMNISLLSLNSKNLKNKYSAYSVQFYNNGNTPLRINNITVSNIINDAEKMNNVVDYSKSFKKSNAFFLAGTANCLVSTVMLFVMPLSIITSGVNSLIDIPLTAGQVFAGQDEINKVKETRFEVDNYSNNKLETIKNEIIIPYQYIMINVLVPKNQTPQIYGVFENINTHEYITVSN